MLPSAIRGSRGQARSDKKHDSGRIRVPGELKALIGDTSVAAWVCWALGRGGLPIRWIIYQ